MIKINLAPETTRLRVYKKSKPQTASERVCEVCAQYYLGKGRAKYCDDCRPIQATSREKKKSDSRRLRCEDPEYRAASYLRNKPRTMARAIERYNTEPEFREKQSRKNIRRKEKEHGAEEGTYVRLLAAQSGVCAICFKLPDDKFRLSIDHCHKANEIRGLLCRRCNVSIGQFEDDPYLLVAAAVYVAKNQEQKQALVDVLRFLVLGISPPSPEV